MPLLTRPLLDRFLERLTILPNGCWSVGLVPSKDGYVYMGRGGRAGGKVLLHRWAYEYWVAPVPRELDVDHTCRNRWCVSPDCGEPVTRRENLRRGVRWPCRS